MRNSKVLPLSMSMELKDCPRLGLKLALLEKRLIFDWLFG